MKLYYLREDKSIDKAFDVARLVLPKTVIERIMKRKGKARDRSALCYLLLAYCLKKEGRGELLDSLRFTPRGKPYVEGVEISLTHTTGLVACAVSDIPVGVDAERIRPVPKSAVKRFLDENELLSFEESENKDILAITQWVIKEAWLKESGRGISTKLKEIAPSRISDNVYEIDGHKIAIFREGEYVLGISAKKALPKKITHVRIGDVL